jgi:hypothetical protein
MANLQVHAVVDEHGRVIAATLGDHGADRAAAEAPSVSLRPIRGQRHVTFDAPAQAAELAGDHLERFFSLLSVSWPADVRVPHVEVIRHHNHD